MFLHRLHRRYLLEIQDAALAPGTYACTSPSFKRLKAGTDPERV